MCPSHRCWGCPEHPPVLPQLESDWQHWDLSSKLEGGVGFTRPVPSCPSSTVPGTRDGEPASCHGGRGTVPAPYSRLSQFCSSTGMLQICGDLVLLLPGASRSYAAVDSVVAAPGEGTGDPLRLPLSPSMSTWLSWHGQGAGLEEPCRQAANLQESRSQSGLGWAVDDPKQETRWSPQDSC